MPRRFQRLSAAVALVGCGLLFAGVGIPATQAQIQRDLVARAQSPGQIKVLGTARPPRRVEPPNAPGPTTLSNVEKVRRIKDVLRSLADEQRRVSNLHLDRTFPLALVTKTKLTVKGLPELLTSRHPYLGTTAYLSFAGPAFVSGWKAEAGFMPRTAEHESNALEAYIDMVEGTTYLLDYSIGLNPGTVKVWFPYDSSYGAAYQLEMPVMNGHLLVPYLAPSTGRAGIWVSALNNPFHFYSLEINTVE